VPGARPLGRPRPLPADSLRPCHADALPGAELELVAGAGHWPWIEDPALVDRVLGFLA
jgi:pimeloyl-ACP methyl ester carboxylesterase